MRHSAEGGATHRQIRSCAAVALTWAMVACSAPQSQPRYVDRMHFVDDDALEPVNADPGDVRLPAGTIIGPKRPKSSPRDLNSAGPPRCANSKDGLSRSVGRATRGSLENGCLLAQRGAGWIRRNAAGWGTDRTVGILQWALAEVGRLHSGTVPVIVGALSREHGGKLRPHRSHQSGRDIDVGYYASNNVALPRFRPMSSGNIDVDKTWTLIGALLHTGWVHYVFIDYNLQALMVRYLEEQGADAQTLARVFQYPAGRRAKRGIIRHARGHADHFHVRFLCISDDGDDCVD